MTRHNFFFQKEKKFTKLMCKSLFYSNPKLLDLAPKKKSKVVVLVQDKGIERYCI